MDIAIVGIGARFPGDDSTPEGFWDLLVKARSAQSEAPKSRYNAKAFYHPDPDRAGSTPATTGHFINQDPGAFDAPFFSITPSEAKAIDPQQRLLLEVAYEALENAGLRIDDLKGSKTSCYAGNFTGDYRDLNMHDNEGHGLYTATGTHTSLVANRVSWFFDLAGPSVTTDTACSASLTAFHLACQGIRNGEADMSLVAGTHLILGPDSTLLLSAGRILSPQGTSKAFDHRADGYGRGEGVGVVVLKPLHAALRDKDTIRAVVLGTAVNHNGRTPSPSQPSSAAQMALIRAAYEQAGIPLSSCGFVEAHGTGTAVGDPLETAAIAETLGKDRTSDLYVGSSKTNIGHLESAAGMAGLIKCIFVVEKGIIPPNIWFEKLNPRIHLPDHVKIPTTNVPWPDNGARIASVNSFGFGGANAHVIIQDAYHFLRERGLFGLHQTDIEPRLPEAIVRNGVNSHTNGQTNGANGHLSGTNGHTNGHTNGYTNGSDGSNRSNGSNGVNGSSSESAPHPKLLVFSAQDKQGTERLGKQLSSYLARKSGQHDENARLLDSLAHTLSSRRSRLLWKTFLLAPSLSVAQTCLSGDPSPLRGATRSSRTPRLAFIFTGQGAQWHAMGRSLFARYTTFQRSIAACDDVLASLGCPWRIRDELFRDEGQTRVNEAQISQPVCVALQTALVDLLARDFKLRPHAVVGHSSGEMGAAYGAGVLSRRAAVALAWHRGVYAARVEEAHDLDGTMLAVRAGGDAVLPWLEKLGTAAGMAVVGCFNSPRNCTVSGDRAALEKLRAALEAEGIGSTPLRVGVAYHSPHMRRIATEYEEAIAGAVKGDVLPSSASGVPFFSSVTGKLLPPSELGPSYWVRNLVSSVNFTGGVQAMLRSAREDDGSSGAPFVDAFVEVGPHSALKTYLAEICAAESVPLSIPYTTLLRRKTDAVETVMTAMGELWCQGADVDLARVNLADAGVRMLTDLPPYPFNHSSSYWAESALTRQYRFREHPRNDHLGVRFAGAVTPQWRNFLRLRENPWLEHSKASSEIVYPRAGFVVMALEAMLQIADLNEEPIAGFELRDVLLSPTELRIPSEDGSVEIMTQVQPSSSTTAPAANDSWADFAIVSRSAAHDDWRTECHGRIRAIRFSASNTPTAQAEARWEHKRLAQAHNDVLAACARPFPAFYETLARATSNREYGPVFRSLRSMHLGKLAARAVVRVPDTASTMPHGFECAAGIIHPAALDALLTQMLAPALMRPGDALADVVPAAPVAVNRMYIAADAGVGSPGREFDVFSKAEGEAGRKVSVYALQVDSPAPAVVLEGVRVAVEERKEEEVGGSSSLCLRTAWREDIDLLTAPQATRAILERAEPDAFDSAHYAMLDLVALPYIRDAVDWLARDGKPYNVSDEEAGFLRLFHTWMVDNLREQAVLVADLATLQAQADAAVSELVKSEAGVVTVELIRRVGENLRGIMTREVEPLQVMLEGGLLYEYYRVGLGTSFNSNVAEYMGLLAHKGAGQLRILEIGGGTGGTTRRILDAVRDADTGASKVAKYVFTDVSPGFLSNAATNFARDAAVLDFRTLNIEEDPVAQGFEAESFDVLVCANVLHATRRIRDTLRRCRALLKPGTGRLVLAELTENPVFMGLMMGPLPGWWLGEEDGRHGGPIMTAAGWDAALKDAGFTGVDLHVRGDRDSREGSPTALIVSTRRDDEPPAVEKSAVCLLVEGGAEADACAGALQSLLAERGEKASIVPWATLSPSAVRGCYCVCLVGLQAPSTMDLAADEVARANDVLASADAVCWVAKSGSLHPLTSLITGTARSEGDSHANKLMAVSLDQLDDTASVDRLAELISRRPLHASLAPHDAEYAISNGIVRIPRAAEAAPLNDALAVSHAQNKADAQPVVLSQTTAPLKLVIGTPGQLDTLHFVADDADAAAALPAGWVEIEVVAAGVNARDVALAAGAVDDEDGDGALGFECSGTVARVGAGVATLRTGDAVAALARGGALAKYVRVPAAMALPLPRGAGLGFEAAAAFVLAYATAYHALVQLGRLQAGESVLIHAAAGAVGQAAIVLAQRCGAEAFVTVGSEQKKELLVNEYGVPGDHVFCSRDQAFAKGIARMTGGRGVDVVLNSLAGESRRLSWHCLSEFGRFLDIGGTEVGLEEIPLLKNRSHFGIDMYKLTKKPNKLIASVMDGVSELVQSGAVKVAKPISVYGAGKIETIFAYMRTGEHMGKTVINMSTDDQVMYTPSPPRITLDQDATYVFAGSVAGADRELARWLVSRGARHLVFLSSSAASHRTDEAYARSLADEQDGLQAAAIVYDVAEKTSLQKALEGIQGSLPPIKGVIVCAMETEASQESQVQPAKPFSGATACQVRTSYNLHDALSASALDFFILVSSGLGDPGIAAFHDVLAQQQNSNSSSRTLSVSLGLVGDHTGSGLRDTPRLRDVQTAIEAALLSEQDSIDTAITIVHLPTASASASTAPYSARLSALQRRLDILERAASTATATTTTNDTTSTETLSAALTRLTTDPQTSTDDSTTATASVVTQHLRARLARLMLVPAEEVDPQRPLGAYGVDSLVAAELRNWLRAETGVDVSVVRLTGADVPIARVAWDIAQETPTRKK